MSWLQHGCRYSWISIVNRRQRRNRGNIHRSSIFFHEREKNELSSDTAKRNTLLRSIGRPIVLFGAQLSLLGNKQVLQCRCSCYVHLTPIMDINTFHMKYELQCWSQLYREGGYTVVRLHRQYTPALFFSHGTMTDGQINDIFWWIPCGTLLKRLLLFPCPFRTCRPNARRSLEISFHSSLP
jgi:hypothetical protein